MQVRAVASVAYRVPVKLDANSLALVLAGIAVVGTLAGGFVGMWGATQVERKRQEFQREQDVQAERAQAMKIARILDGELAVADALLIASVEKHNRVWPAFLIVPDETIWIELRGDVALFLDSHAWLAVKIGFMALRDLREMSAGHRAVGYDDTKDLSPKFRAHYDPVILHIRAAREALYPLAYPGLVVRGSTNDEP
jgi:hypothetical protein